MTRLIEASPHAIAEAASHIRKGDLVAIPTETVYGLAADARNGKAVARIFAAKGRPRFNPLIIHIENSTQAENFALFDDRARQLAEHFWPGPLTLILPRRKDNEISELATAGLDTIAIRAPAHPVARDLIAQTGPLAAPSANRSGRVSATTPAHVFEELEGHLAMILAAGSTEIGLESTVLDLSGDNPVILRPGAVLATDIATLLDTDVLNEAKESNPEKPKSPGLLLKHYAPEATLRLNAVDLEPGEALLAFGNTRFMGIRGGGAAKDLPDGRLANLSENADLYEASANLFKMLRGLDRSGTKKIAVMTIPDEGLGLAINDRLRRAAS